MSESTDWEVRGVDDPLEREPWPWRPLLLAAIGAAAGFVAWLIVQGHEVTDLSAGWLALLVAVTASAGLTGFTLERRDWIWSLGFSVASGLVAAGIVYWNGSPDDWGGGDGWRIASLFLALAIAAPLFQAARDSRAVRFPYPLAYDHAWTNVVLWCACWAFVGIFFLLLVLLSGLFGLIKLNFLSDLLREEWFVSTLIGLAFGAALGVFREQDGVVRLLQRIVATVLAVLAPVLAVGLAVFLLALPFTGLTPLWEGRIDATPLLLACVVGSLILANVVIGKLREQEFRFAPFRIGAMVLAVVMLPLAILAAVATGLRIDQYGFTPERLWALTFVVIATAFGLAYWVSLARGRMEWAAFARPANRNLALGLCGLALLLATPLVSFNVISTNDQVARLRSGRIMPEKFDWRALAFDFGVAGKTALKQLQASANAAIRAKAIEAGKANSRWDVAVEVDRPQSFAGTVDVRPAGAALQPELRALIVDPKSNACTGSAVCRVFLQPDARVAVVLNDACAALPTEQRADPKTICAIDQTVFVQGPKGWSEPEFGRGGIVSDMTTTDETASLRAEREAITRGDVTVRTVTRRQAFVGNKPIGGVFE